MLLTISTTHVPATDLGFLLHKNPGRPQAVEVSTGTAHVFYPQADEQRCTAALLLDVDPIALVRATGPSSEGSLGQYVNDRPYAASSLLAVALGKVFSSARRGLSKERPELAARPLPLEVHLPALSCRGGVETAGRFFAPLGWTVEAVAVPLDPAFPEWGASRYVDLTLTGELRLADALNHLYVALPVLDDAKHYWVSSEEIDKLLRAGAGWLADHPERDWIARGYLAHQKSLSRQAIARLAEVDDTDAETLDDALAPARTATGAHDDADAADDAPDRPVPLALQRHGAVLAALRSVGARRVVDLGCGSGALLPALIDERSLLEIVGVDVSHRALEQAARRLRLDRAPERVRERVRLLQGALTYTDDRLQGYDAAILMEVIEHVDEDRLPALEHAVFGHAAPVAVIVTTPNVEHNVRYETLAAGALRHRDHRFEWTRAQFADWAGRTADRYGYGVRLVGVGAEDAEVGPPTQMAVFTKASSTPLVAAADGEVAA